MSDYTYPAIVSLCASEKKKKINGQDTTVNKLPIYVLLRIQEALWSLYPVTIPHPAREECPTQPTFLLQAKLNK